MTTASPPAAAQPMRIRAQASGDKTLVRVLMLHEMESGVRRDTAGKLIPAWHIQEVVATLNGKTVLSAQFGAAVSKDPFLQFSFKGGKPGDKLAVRWKDNRGTSRSDETTVA